MVNAETPAFRASSALTIDRVEAGRPCRLDTKRKILFALGIKVTDRDRIFGALAGRDPEQVAAEFFAQREA